MTDVARVAGRAVEQLTVEHDAAADARRHDHRHEVRVSLRRAEHRIQLQRLRRTHTVPDDPAALRWLAHALGYRPTAARDAVEAFRAEWVRHAGEVRRLHAKLLYRPLLEAVARVPSEQLRLTPEAARARLAANRGVALAVSADTPRRTAFSTSWSMS